MQHQAGEGPGAEDRVPEEGLRSDGISTRIATPSGKPRARAFGIPFDGEPGPSNAITDVPGVSVGYTTLISGDGTLVVGKGPVRTGVTAILPRPRADLATPVFAGIFSANGNGELTGSHLIEEIGAFNLPVTITNTHSCGVARDGTLRWMHERAARARWTAPGRCRWRARPMTAS